MKTFDERQVLAAQRLVEGATLQEAADAAGVNRATVIRWRQDPAFRDFQADQAKRADDAGLRARAGLEALVPKALKLLDEALEPGSKITGQAAKNALDVIKAASAMSREEGAAGGGTLEARIVEIDEKLGGQSLVSD